MARQYDASSIRVIENDRERLRKRPLTYIPSRQKEGASSIFFEIVDNSIDEVTVKGSVGKTIHATFDSKTKVMSVKDDGSGIPLEKLYDVCTIINSSGKFDNDENTAYTYSGGLNGVGLKATVYLSKWANVKSTRDGKSLMYKFEDGYLKDTIKENEKGHGTYVEFLLDPEFADPHEITAEELLQLCEEKSYLFPDVNLIVDILKDGKLVKSHKFSGKDMHDWITKKKPDTPVISIDRDVRTKAVLAEIDDENLRNQKVITTLTFGYKEAVLDAVDPMQFMISFGNTIRTTTGGTHVDGLKLGVQKFFKQNVIPKFKGKDKDLQIMPVDMVSGLCGFVWVQLTTPDYRGQFKDQLNNPEAKYAVRDAVYDALCNAKPSTVNPMIDFVKRVARGRMASKKTRKKDVSNAFSKDRLEKFKDVVYNLNTTSPELILAEGDSACDNAASARDPYNQAIYGIRRPKNIFDTPTEQVARIKSTFNDVLDICGIEPGKKCDPEKSTMNHILMLTDGDIDGDDIAISTICLLAKHCKPLIDAGMVGRILPPAYAIPMGNGKYSYVRSQREFFDKITKMFIKTATVSYKGTELSKKELRAFIEKNFEYDTRLEKLANRYCVDPNVMEYIAWNYHGELKDQKKSYWMKVLKRYPGVQILIEDNMLVFDGDIKGSDYMNLALDDHFHKHVMRFKEYQKKNSTIEGYSLNKDDGLTVYDVMRHLRKVMPSGIKRFKGLGELEPEEMRALCMDKESRTVIIFKFSDFEKDMDKINVIMSTKAEHARARKELMMSMRIDDLDLDT